MTHHQWPPGANIKKDSVNAKRYWSWLQSQVFDKRRYYIKSIVDVIKFLAVNALSLRGDYNKETHSKSELFQNLLSYKMKKDQKLSQILKKNIPNNAKYTSQEFQNLIIDDLASIITESIAADV